MQKLGKLAIRLFMLALKLGEWNTWASMSSGIFQHQILKPTVQVGDPFSEKLLMEACLELMDNNTVVTQDREQLG